MRAYRNEDINKAYIDATYYTSVFKPNKNAMIQGSFNNVEANRANFEAFSLRASELADRILNNKVTELGGIDFIAPTPQGFIKKAVASLVQLWFMNGYNTAQIDTSISIGSFSAHQIKTNETLRKIISLDALVLLQKTKMWDGRVIGVEISERIKSLGFDLNDLLFIDDALDLFQLKGDYDDNFHEDINYFSTLTQAPGNHRFICIAKTTRRHVSFEALGGAGHHTQLVKTLLMLDNQQPEDPTLSGAYQYNQSITNTLPNYYARTEQKRDADGNLYDEYQIWVEVEDSTLEKDSHILVSNIYADDKGEYKLHGSVTNIDNTYKLIPKQNILEKADITAVTNSLTSLEASLRTLSQQLGTVTQVANGASQSVKDIPVMKQQLAQALSDIANNKADVNNLVANLNFLRDNVELGLSKTITNDGDREMLPTYTPVRPYSVATKKYADDLAQNLQNQLNGTPYTGWEALWNGTLSGTKKAGDDALYFSLSGLSPSKGVLRYNEGQMTFITFETNGLDDNPEVMIVRTDNKLDRLDIQSGVQYYYKGNINTNGEVQVRRYNQTNGNLIDLPIADIKIVRVYQINGVQSASGESDMDDATITDIEGVII